MKAIISAISGLISFVLISGAQLNLLMLRKASHHQENLAEIYSIGYGTKIIISLLALLAIWSSIYYNKTGGQKYNIINRVGRLLGIVAILLCFIPLHLIINPSL